MGFVTFCKEWLKSQLEARGVVKVWTRAEANANYQVQKSAVILVFKDLTETAPEKHERFVGTKDKKGQYNHDGRLHTYRSHRERRLVLEASIIGPSESWVDEVIDGLMREVPRRLKQTGVVLEDDKPGADPGDPVIPGETDDVWMGVEVVDVVWHDDESLLRNLEVAQVYIEFKRPNFKVVLEPHWEEAEMNPNLTTDI